ncbi:MAG: arsenate reductase (glutaredoxin) [Pantoea sp.]|uniref:arsenate reductase (glutaredoxin) n=1 Tax=Pantoea septica TaxID=472695 RepID=UPI000E954448|nr:arsenate reductase (glutaredoxin) [Pantoea septica]MBU5375966.1 arsenate reductase (glutaredoxin) [Pantoea septica]MDU5839502.1 arsenate reductase (glutaredoxin) [Pantoea sp.]MDU6441202.1 arsenate reductase (glutaredoxin) [Pantoea sp.]HAT24966.1 arsenate reductase (glutaredoxin) [Pantoea septica]
MVTIYHNPRCSKSRETLALLEANGVKPEIVRYLETPPDRETLQILLQKLGMSSVRQLMRTKEELYKTLRLDDADEAQLLDALTAHPVLLERPIVINGDRARIGRPPEAVLEIL